MQNPDLDYEKRLWKKGLKLVAGIDEAGRGAWAGPVAAGAVILPLDEKILSTLHGVRDSKQMTARQRGIWAEIIKKTAIAWSVGLAANEEIDAIGILPATRLAMERAIGGLRLKPEHLLIDAVKLKVCEIPQSNIIKGDVKVLSISAASVLAKTARDALMIEMDQRFPAYGFSRHKGYGTKLHRKQLQNLGVLEIHRMSFTPIKEIAGSKL